MRLPKFDVDKLIKYGVGIAGVGIGLYFIKKGLTKLGLRIPKLPIVSDVGKKVEKVGKELVQLAD